MAPAVIYSWQFVVVTKVKKMDGNNRQIHQKTLQVLAKWI